jgi:hypothetical protein
MYSPTFAELAGSEKVFFSTYFNRAPLYRPGALTGDPRELLSIAELDTIMQFEAIRPPYIRITTEAGGVLEGGFTTTTRVQSTIITDTVVPSRAYELLRTGATISWNSVNHYHAGLRELTRMLAVKFAIRSDVVAFLTPAGRQGFTPHHDPVDLFIIQLEGTKHWKLWQPPSVRRGDLAHYKETDLGPPVLEMSLQPGDVLYLPYNTPHVAVAQEQMSLHLSVMIRPRMWSDLLRLTAGRLLADPAFREFPYLTEATVSDQAKVLEDRAGLLAGRLRDIDRVAEISRLIDEGRQSLGSSHGETFQQLAAIDHIGPADRLQRTIASISFGEADTGSGKTKAKINGHTVALPTPVATTLQDMSTADEITAGELYPAAGQERSASTARALARLGILSVTGESHVHSDVR